MIDTVTGSHFAQIKRINTFQAGDVVAVLARHGSALVVGIDAAIRTKIMFGAHGVELVKLQDLLAFDDPDSR